MTKIFLLFILTIGIIYNIYRRKEIEYFAEVLSFQFMGFLLLFALLIALIFKYYQGQYLYYLMIPLLLAFFYTANYTQGFNDRGLFHFSSLNLLIIFSPWGKIKIKRVEYDRKLKLYRLEMMRRTSFQSFIQYYNEKDMKKILAFAKSDHITINYDK